MHKNFYIVSNVIFKFLIGISPVIIARNISPHEFGIFSTYLSIANLTMTVAVFGLIEYFLISYSRREDLLPDFISWGLLLCAIILLTSIIFSNYYFILVVLWVLSIKATTALYGAVLQVKEKYITAGLMYLLISFVVLVFLILYGSYQNLGVKMFLAYSASTSTFVIAGFILVMSLGHCFKAFLRLPNISYIKNSYRFGLSAIFAYVYMSSDVVMLYFLDSKVSSGIYASTAAILFSVYMFFDVVYKFKLPLYSKSILNNNSSLIIQKFTNIVAVVSASFLAFVIIFGEKIVGVIYGEEYLAAGGVLKILGFVVFLHAYCYPYGMIISSHGMQAKKNKVQLFVAVVNIVLNMILIPKYGIDGALLATVISEVFLLALYYNVAKAFEKEVSIPIISMTMNLFLFLICFFVVELIMDNVIYELAVSLFVACILILSKLNKDISYHA